MILAFSLRSFYLQMFSLIVFNFFLSYFLFFFISSSLYTCRYISSFSIVVFFFLCCPLLLFFSLTLCNLCVNMCPASSHYTFSLYVCCYKPMQIKHKTLDYIHRTQDEKYTTDKQKITSTTSKQKIFLLDTSKHKWLCRTIQFCQC